MIPPLLALEMWLCLNDAMGLINLHPCLLNPYLQQVQSPLTAQEIEEIGGSPLAEHPR